MKTRAITGFFFVMVMLASVFAGDYIFSVFVLLLSLASLNEFYMLVSSDTIKPQRIQGNILGLAVFVPIAAYVLKGDDLACVLLSAPAAILIFISELYRKSSSPVQNISYTFFGIIFAVLPFSFFHALGFLEGAYNFHFPLGFLLMLWAYDTSAYLFGIKLGKTKLFEKHSPKKTWEGLAGGMAISLLTSQILGHYFTELSAMNWAAVSIIICISGTYGDLTESMFKRSVDKKDSGSILPGHGGLLDRFDGLLLSAPLVFVYLYFILN